MTFMASIGANFTQSLKKIKNFLPILPISNSDFSKMGMCKICPPPPPPPPPRFAKDTYPRFITDTHLNFTSDSQILTQVLY